MAVHEIRHPHWGSNFENQLSTAAVREYGEDGNGYKTVTVPSWFGWQRQKKQYVGYVHRIATDDDAVKRTFLHRCGLIRIIMTPHRYGPMLVVFLDGHVASNFIPSEMEFRFAPDDLQENDGKPIAEIWFHGIGKRRGPLDNYCTSRIICTFSNKEQMDQYLDLTNRRMPRSITHDGMVYSMTSDGQYQSRDGSVLPYLLVMYFLLSPSEQQAFAAQNPEVQSMLGDTTQNDSIADGPYSDGGDYGDQGDQSGDSDFGGSGDMDGGDSGGGGDGGGGGD